MWTGLVRKKCGAAGSDISVGFADALLIVRREVVADGERRAVEFEDGVAVVAATVVGVERAVASGDVEVAFRVDGGSGIAEPDSGFAAVGIYVEDGLLCECLRVVGHHPAVVG